jgi:hypothetical protein
MDRYHEQTIQILQLQKVENPSFVIFPNMFSTENIDIKKMYNHIKKNGNNIFQQRRNFNSGKQDNTRKLIIGNSMPKELYSSYANIQLIVNELFKFDEYFVSEESAIASLPNGTIQAWHSDFDIKTPDARYNYIVFAGLQNSALEFIASIENRSAIKTLNYSAGDIVVCRGDLIHRGISYAEPNVRLHYFVDSKVRNARIHNKIYLYRKDKPCLTWNYLRITLQGIANLNKIKATKRMKRESVEQLNKIMKQRKEEMKKDHVA